MREHDEWELEREPWLADGSTVYAWIAARPELHSLAHWKIEPAEYAPWGKDDSAWDHCGIYFLMNETGGCYYIGQSLDIDARLRAHWKADRVPFTHVWVIPTPSGAMNVLEAFLIGLNHPPYNRKYCPTMKTWAGQLRATLYP